MEEIREMLELLHSGTADTNRNIAIILNELKTDIQSNGYMTIADFITWTQRKPGVVSPVFKLQQLLQSKFLGQSFWSDLTSKRYNSSNPKIRHPKYLNDVRMLVRKLKKQYGARREAHKAEMSRQALSESLSRRVTNVNTGKVLERFMGKKGIAKVSPVNSAAASRQSSRGKSTGDSGGGVQGFTDLSKGSEGPTSPSEMLTGGGERTSSRGRSSRYGALEEAASGSGGRRSHRDKSGSSSNFNSLPVRPLSASRSRHSGVTVPSSKEKEDLSPTSRESGRSSSSPKRTTEKSDKLSGEVGVRPVSAKVRRSEGSEKAVRKSSAKSPARPQSASRK